jgi:non-specific serine/threonine protein kinase
VFRSATDTSDSRFKLLDTVRAFALEQLRQQGEEDAVRARQVDYFTQLAQATEPNLSGPNQVRWLQRLDEEHPNLRTVLDWLIDAARGDPTTDTHAQAALVLCAAVWRFWYLRAHFLEGRRWLGRVLDLPVATQSTLVRARALNGAGSLAYSLGDFAAAATYHERSLAIRRELGDQQGIAGSLNNLALVDRHTGEFARARARLEEAIALNRQLGNEAWLAINFNNLGGVLLDQGDAPGAESSQERSLALFTELGDEWGIGMSLCDLANATRERGDLDRAQTLYEEALRRQGVVGDRRGRASSLVGRSWIALDIESATRAQALIAQAQSLFDEIGDRRGAAACLEALACVAAKQDQHTTAARLMGAADTERANLGSVRGPAESANLERRLARARRALGEARWQRELHTGQTLTPELAAVEAPGADRARNVESTAARAAEREAEPEPALSARETVVAQQVVRGLSNRQIAEQLVLSERTVETHVAHILERLGLANRTQLAAWAARHGLS